MTAPTPQSIVRRDLHSLEDLTTYWNSFDDRRREELFWCGDVLAAFVAERAGGNGHTQAVARGLCRSIAAGSRGSANFLYNLFRVSYAFPPEFRELYEDRSWAWFMECTREANPLEAAARYCNYTVGQIKDFRKTNKVTKEPGYTRLQLTLRPDQMAEILRGGQVSLTRLLPDEQEITVLLKRRAS